MAKFFGHIGYGTDVEIGPGVYEKVIVERPYYGEVIRDVINNRDGNTVLGNRKTNNAFRIVADGYADQHFSDIVYLKWQGRFWDVEQIELQNRPRMVIRIGGIYNGPTFEAPVDSGSDSGE